MISCQFKSPSLEDLFRSPALAYRQALATTIDPEGVEFGAQKAATLLDPVQITHKNNGGLLSTQARGRLLKRRLLLFYWVMLVMRVWWLVTRVTRAGTRAY